jgi:hypothetical protein
MVALPLVIALLSPCVSSHRLGKNAFGNMKVGLSKVRNGSA